MTDQRPPSPTPWTPWAARAPGNGPAPGTGPAPTAGDAPTRPLTPPPAAPWAPQQWTTAPGPPWAPPVPPTAPHGSSGPPPPPPGYGPGPMPGAAPPPRLPGPEVHPIPDRGGRLGSAMVGALVGALVAALIAGAIVASSTTDERTEVVQGPPSTLGAPGPGGSGRRLDVPSLLAAAQPSVVSIETGQTQSPFGGAGSGFVLSADGLIVTNAHVVAGADEIRVTFTDGTTEPAELVGSFPDNDVAMVRVSGRTDLVPARLGSSDALRVGDDVVAIGNALNLGGQPSVTLGIVSGKDRSIEEPGITLDHLIQTDAAINHGNSGGPLLNAGGEVVGINTAIAAEAQNVGFAIAIDSVKSLIEDLKAGKGEINPENAFLGVRTIAVDDPSIPPELLDRYGVTAESGTLVVEVTPDSAADKAGVREGDVLVTVDGERAATNAAVADAIRAHEPGDRISVTYERRGRRRTVPVTLGRRGG